MKENNLGTFKLFPVGRLVLRDNRTFVKILPDYRLAMKHMELFSHIFIFFEYGEKYQVTKVPKEFQDIFEESDILRNMVCENKIAVSVSRIIASNIDDGIVELDYVNAYDGAVIHDIKPYIPFDDRVKVYDVIENMKKWPKWRPELDVIYNNKIEEIDVSIEMGNNVDLVINQIGVVRKREGDYYLELAENAECIYESLAHFSHLRLLWWFNRFDNKTYRRITQNNPPYENAPKTGVFASRSPIRPNPIALTTVKILGVDASKRVIKVSGLDAFDKTPIIDIKPYIPVYDRVKEFSVPQWISHWPEWVGENEEKITIDNIKLRESDIDKLKKITSNNFHNNIEEGVNTKVFEEVCVKKVYDYENIVIKGVRQNNLKNIDTTIPKNKITVITGVSGSGKSSFAFDTIYAESQRRFMDSISTSGRMIFEQLEKPDVEQIFGLPPAIAIEQRNISRNPRSTVGTITDIYDYIRLLFSRTGTRHCPECGRAIKVLQIEEIINSLACLSPKTEFKINAFGENGLVGEFTIPEENVSNDEKKRFVDNLKKSVRKGLEKGNGAIKVTLNDEDELLLQSRNMCYHCNRVFFELTSSTFSFNNPEGMCPDCNGLGVKLIVDPALIVSKPELSILDEASKWWGNLRKHRKNPNANWMRGEVLALAEEMKVDLEVPWNKLPEDFREQALYGSNGREVRLVYENKNGRRGEIVRPVLGAYNHITRLFKENQGDTAARITLAFMREKQCPTCKGERLSAEGRLVTLGNIRFPEIVGMTIEELNRWVTDLPSNLTKEQLQICSQLLNEINKRLQALIDVGVHYLTLDRPVPTLSGGEAQRIKLATRLGCGLTNLLYILDEPSIGLHPRDQKLLIKTIKDLRDEGNTLLIVEHDSDTMFAADKIIDIGPGAGEYGGTIIAEGTPEEILNNHKSETGKYLKGIKKVESVRQKGRKKPDGRLKISGAKENNLHDIDVSFPLGVYTCVTGVSGSGKSSLVSMTLYPALAKYLNNSNDVPGIYNKIEGLERLDKVINVTQSPIGRTPRSNPATYTGVFDDIRDLFAKTEEAKKRGYKKSRFSFNGKEGRCESCGGEGRKHIEMHFMPDIWVECSECRGKRFNAETLEIQYKGKSISDVLEMDVREALEFFKEDNKVNRVLQTLHDVGLDYIKLGQSALTISGGEAQRIKLAKELSRPDTGKTIYILDEPTTGLHFKDVQNLLNVIDRITNAGNTVIVIEHNLDMMKNADWIIDMGPEGGSEGGYVVAQGTPEEVAENEESYTGRFLKNAYI